MTAEVAPPCKHDPFIEYLNSISAFFFLKNPLESFDTFDTIDDGPFSQFIFFTSTSFR